MSFLNTQDKGDLAKIMVVASLLKRGNKVLETIGENHEFDLVFYSNERIFKTVQCKLGRYRNGCVQFNLYSVVVNSSSGKKEKRGYSKFVDYFGVYCIETDKCYLVPNNEKLPKNEVYLRVDIAKSNRGTNKRYAKDYEL